MSDAPRIEWHPWPTAFPGEHARFGGLVLEANTNGSWVVWHYGHQINERKSQWGSGGDLKSAKAAAEEAALAILERPEPKRPVPVPDPVPGGDADRERAITLRLCHRYMALRVAQSENNHDAAGLAERLELDVAQYLNKNQQPK